MDLGKDEWKQFWAQEEARMQQIFDQAPDDQVTIADFAFF